MYQDDSPNFVRISLSAVWQLLPFLKAWLELDNVGSNITSRIILITSRTTLSLVGAIVKCLERPLALGICILLPGLKLKVLFFNESMILAIVSEENPSKLVGLIPGVLFPGLLFRLL